MDFPEIEAELNAYSNALRDTRTAICNLWNAIFAKVSEEKRKKLIETLFYYKIDHYYEDVDIDDIINELQAQFAKVLE